MVMHLDLRETSQCAEIPGNPWLSDKSARFSYLLQSLKVEWNPFESQKLLESEPPKCCSTTPNSSAMSTESAVELLMTIVDDVTVHSLQRLKQSVCWEKVDESDLCSNLRKAINQKSEHEIQKSIRNLLLHLKSVSSGEQSVWFAVQILLIAYIERFQKPLAQVLADPIFELASSKTNENFVFSRLLPAIVLIPDLYLRFTQKHEPDGDILDFSFHRPDNALLLLQVVETGIGSLGFASANIDFFSGNRQSEFAQKLLQVASPSSRLCTLSNICSTNHRWPQEIYPVLRLLLNPMGSAHEENEEDQSCAWTSELYIAIVDAFSHQVQENPALTSSTQFANLLLFFLREHRSKLPPCTRPSLSQLAQQHTGFLRKPLCDLVAAICSSTMNIGDKFLTELLETKHVREDVFRGKRVFNPNRRTIYGGELMAQGLVAASKTVPNNYRPHSLHCYFHDRASVKQPNEYQVTRLRDSRSFSHRLVEAFPVDGVKKDDRRPFFRMDCSFKIPEEDPASFVARMPKVPPVERVQDFHSFLDSINQNSLADVPRARIKQFLEFEESYPVEIKFCEPEYVVGLRPNPTGRLHAWMRIKETPTVDLHPYRDAILTYFSDALLIWVSLTEPLPVYYLVTLNQSIWFHNPHSCPEPDEWLLFETRSNFVGGALTLSYGAMWNKEGDLLASMAQQGLVRTQQMTPVSSSNSLEEKKVSNSH